MVNVPSPGRLSTLPKWAQEYVAWLRARVTHLEAESKFRADLLERTEGIQPESTVEFIRDHYDPLFRKMADHP